MRAGKDASLFCVILCQFPYENIDQIRAFRFVQYDHSSRADPVVTVLLRNDIVLASRYFSGSRQVTATLQYVRRILSGMWISALFVHLFLQPPKQISPLSLIENDEKIDAETNRRIYRACREEGQPGTDRHYLPQPDTNCNQYHTD